MHARPLPRRALALLFALLTLVAPARATWSIVVVDLATGEVCVASATCLQAFDLQAGLAVLVPGVGGAAAQSQVDTTGANRLAIWNGLQAGLDPAVILADLAQSDVNHQKRQYGIVDFAHAPLTFTGTGANAAKGGVTGSVGSLRYAIQGNVLTGIQVVHAAEAALLATPGDLSQRVMAGMEAARALGGDGRCSCSQFAPTFCGVPPPNFTKSAHVGFVALARLGDSLGGCSQATGCANGAYYLDLEVKGLDGAANDPDAVLQLQAQYVAWRASKAGVPDHLLSTVKAGAQALIADGEHSTLVRVRLVDLEGAPLAQGGAALTLDIGGSAPGLLSAGPVLDLGDGSYEFELQANTQLGSALVAITVDDGSGPVLLHPPLALELEPAAALHCGQLALSAAQGASVPFSLQLGAASAGRPYALLASASGTQPGLSLPGGALLPLNPDAIFELTAFSLPSGFFAGQVGLLDAQGKAQLALPIPPGLLSVLAGGQLDFAALLRGSPLGATNADGFSITP
jgi:hypothetical protein